MTQRFCKYNCSTKTPHWKSHSEVKAFDNALKDVTWGVRHESTLEITLLSQHLLPSPPLPLNKTSPGIWHVDFYRQFFSLRPQERMILLLVSGACLPEISVTTECQSILIFLDSFHCNWQVGFPPPFSLVPNLRALLHILAFSKQYSQQEFPEGGYTPGRKEIKVWKLSFNCIWIWDSCFD